MGMPGADKAEAARAQPASWEASVVVRVLLVGSFVAAALAANDFIVQSSLVIDAVIRRVFF
jgi:hypothetical protein